MLFEDCNAIRDSISNTNLFSEKSLISFTSSYNSCDYNVFKPTDDELKNANSFNSDQFKFNVGLGLDVKNIHFFDKFYDENINQYGLKLGLLVTPSFTGNLYFFLMVPYFLEVKTILYF